MRNIARPAAFTTLGLALGAAIFVGGSAYQSAQAAHQADSAPVVSATSPALPVTRTVTAPPLPPAPAVTVTQTIRPAPKVVTKTIEVPVKVRVPNKVLVTVYPFGFNVGDCVEEDSCHPDYLGQDQDRWVIKPGERPAR